MPLFSSPEVTLLLLLLLLFWTFELSPFGLVSKGVPQRAGVHPGSLGGPKPEEQFCHPLLTHCKSYEDGGTAQALELVFSKCRDVELLRQCHLVALGTHDSRESWQDSHHMLVSPRSPLRSPKQSLEIRKGAHCHAPLANLCHPQSGLSSPR